MEQILKSSQEQGAAAWIDYLRVLRIETLLDKLSDQDCNLEKAIKALDEVKAFIATPEPILGSFATKHGEIAEHMQVGFSNAEAAIMGKEQLYTFNGVGRLAMEDYLRDGQMIQSKFYNGVKGTFQAVCKHLNDYPHFITNGGTYEIPKDQYEKLIDIYNRGETAHSSLITIRPLLIASQKFLTEMKSTLISVAENLTIISGTPIDDIECGQNINVVSLVFTRVAYFE